MRLALRRLQKGLKKKKRTRNYSCIDQVSEGDERETKIRSFLFPAGHTAGLMGSSKFGTIPFRHGGRASGICGRTNVSSPPAARMIGCSAVGPQSRRPGAAVETRSQSRNRNYSMRGRVALARAGELCSTNWGPPGSCQRRSGPAPAANQDQQVAICVLRLFLHGRTFSASRRTARAGKPQLSSQSCPGTTWNILRTLSS